MSEQQFESSNCGYHGITAINQDKIVTMLLNQFMRAVIPCVKKKVEDSVKIEVAKVTYSCSFSNDPLNENDKFVPVDGNKYSYQYDSSADSGKKVVYIPPFLGTDTRFKADYHVSCSVETGTMTSADVTYPSLNITTRITAGADFMYDSQHSKGIYFDKKIEYQIGIKVCEDGTIQFIRKGIETDMKPSGIDVNGWSKFCGIGEIGSVVSSMKTAVQGFVDDFIEKIEDSFR